MPHLFPRHVTHYQSRGVLLVVLMCFAWMHCYLCLPCRKVHLFDIDIPGKMTFKESLTLTPGATPTVVDTAAGRLGIGICYDIRFPELAMLYAKRGVQALVYPGKGLVHSGAVCAHGGVACGLICCKPGFATSSSLPRWC